MKEDFLHYLWQFQYFDKKALTTEEGELLSVLHTGHHNHHSGPDFSQSRLRIDGIAWIGQVEIHTKASDWYKHGHQHDDAYENVILHVVWESDLPVWRQDGSLIPCLVLEKRVAPSLKHRYWDLLSQTDSLPCKMHLAHLPSILPIATLESAMISRLERRRLEWLSLVEEFKGDWEQVAYHQLARYLGAKINDTPFIAMSQQLPWKELQRHRGNLTRIEALIFGIAGLLKEAPVDDYQKKLQQEYHWLGKNQVLEPIPFAWKWGRRRVGNFPSIRLAQLAALASHRPQLFSSLWHQKNLKEVRALLTIPMGEYWDTHYRFGKERKAKAQWGVDNLLINWLVPLWYTYGSYYGKVFWQERAIELLQELPIESIQKLKLYKEAGFPLQQASDSQAALELHEYFCKPKRCLSCTIGVKVMGRDALSV